MCAQLVPPLSLHHATEIIKVSSVWREKEMRSFHSIKAHQPYLIIEDCFFLVPALPLKCFSMDLLLHFHGAAAATVVEVMAH